MCVCVCVCVYSQADYRYGEINDKMNSITLKLGDAKVCTYVYVDKLTSCIPWDIFKGVWEEEHSPLLVSYSPPSIMQHKLDLGTALDDPGS